MKIMVLTPYLPHSQVGHGGGTAVRDLVRHLAARHEVMVVSLVRPAEELLVQEVKDLGVKVTGLPFLDSDTQGLKRGRLLAERSYALGRSLVSGYPFYVEKYWSESLSQKVLTVVQNFQPDAIQIEYLQMALHCRDIQKWRDKASLQAPRLILNSHELGSLPRQRRADRAPFLLQRIMALADAKAWRRLQVDATQWADQTLCVTPQDYHLYSAMGGKRLTVVPLGMDTEAIEADWAPQLPEQFLFIGSFGHRPNVLAAEFLLNVAWPDISRSRPEAQLILAGRGSTEFLFSHGSPEQWATKKVKALGFVDDLAPHFRTCRLFLAPLPEGGGIKIKILETMARGVPVVTTEVGVEGITTAEDGTAIIAPCDEGFAQAVISLADDMSTSRELAAKARIHIENNFSWNAIADQLSNIYRGDN